MTTHRLWKPPIRNHCYLPPRRKSRRHSRTRVSNLRAAKRLTVLTLARHPVLFRSRRLRLIRLFRSQGTLD